VHADFSELLTLIHFLLYTFQCQGPEKSLLNPTKIHRWT